MFSDEELKRQFSDVLNHKNIIPDGHKGAIVAYADRVNGQTGITIGIATRTDAGWVVESELTYHPQGEGMKAGVTVMKTW